MLTIGLTGGIGSGKSTVAALFAEKSIAIIDADEIARELTQPNTPALQEIITYFGESILIPTTHILDRLQLRHLIFSDPEKKEWLENLLHPLIRDKLKKRILQATSLYCIAVIPLLLESAEKNPNTLVDRILVVNTSEALQIKRTQARDNLPLAIIKNIIQSQINQTKRLQQADDIIQNTGDKRNLISQIDKFHEFYLSLARA